MAVSRPLILALLAAILCAITFYAATGAQRTSSESSAATPATPPADVAESAPERPEPAQSARERERGGAPERERAREGRNRTERPRRREAAPLPPELRVEGLPRPVARALAQRRTIVLFFRQSAADDALTADAVDGVRGLRGLSVFSAPIDRLGRYRAVVPGLAIARAPAVAIIDRKRSARVLEGFVDPGTLRQLVLDAR
jgi:hypothetical protein